MRGKNCSFCIGLWFVEDVWCQMNIANNRDHLLGNMTYLQSPVVNVWYCRDLVSKRQLVKEKLVFEFELLLSEKNVVELFARRLNV